MEYVKIMIVAYYNKGELRVFIVMVYIIALTEKSSIIELNLCYLCMNNFL